MSICIYCLNDSSTSKNRAHITPESFLKNDTTLPLGVECDSCNKYASKLEQAFIHHNRIWVPIMLLRAPGKGGKKRKQLGHYTADEKKNVITVRFPITWLKVQDGKREVVFPDP